jgi:hypothetical protein
MLTIINHFYQEEVADTSSYKQRYFTKLTLVNVSLFSLAPLIYSYKDYF